MTGDTMTGALTVNNDIFATGTVMAATLQSGDTITGGSIEVTGTATAAQFFTSGALTADTILATSGLEVTGNATAGFFIGDGSQLTNVPLSAHNHDTDYVKLTGDTMTGALTVNNDIFATGTVMAATLQSGDTITGASIEVTGTATAAQFFTSGALTADTILATSGLEVTGNATAGFFIGDGSQLTNVPLSAHNHDADYVNLSGDTMTGALTVNNDIFATGTVMAATLQSGDTITGGSIEVTGTATAAQFFTSGALTADTILATSGLEVTGNATAGFFIGDGSQLTNVPLSAHNHDTDYVKLTGDTMTGALTVNNDIFATGTVMAATLQSGDTITGGSIEVTGTATAAQFFTSGALTADTILATSGLEVTGNATAGFFIGDGSQLTNVPLSAHNHDADYVNLSGDTMTGALTVNNDIFATGTVMAATLQSGDTITGGSIEVTGTATAAQFFTSGALTADTILATSGLEVTGNATAGFFIGDGSQLTNVPLSAHNHDTDYVNLTGDTMTGALSVTQSGATASISVTQTGAADPAAVFYVTDPANPSAAMVVDSMGAGNLTELHYNGSPMFAVDIYGNVFASGAVYMSDSNLVSRYGDTMTGALSVAQGGATASISVEQAGPSDSAAVFYTTEAANTMPVVSIWNEGTNGALDIQIINAGADGNVINVSNSGSGAILSGNAAGGGRLLELGAVGVNKLLVDNAGTTWASGTVVFSNGYMNFGSAYGFTGYGFRDNAGILEYKNDLGAWAPVGGGGSYVPLAGGAMTGGLTISSASATGSLYVDNTNNASSARFMNAFATATVYAENSNAGPAVYGRNTGAGVGGYFDTNGSNFAVYGLNTGTGTAGYFEIFNGANAAPVLKAETDGVGSLLELHNSGSPVYTVGASGNIAASGTVKVGNDTGIDGYDINFYGAMGGGNTGARMYWDADKSALRAGRADAAQWDDPTVGEYSFAAGFNAIASNNSSAALGANTVSTGITSTAMGNNTVASGMAATSMGAETVSSGVAATALGYSSTAGGYASLAAGEWVTAGPNANTFAIGKGVDNVNRLVNNTTNSLGVGFNSDVPTFFVGPASGIGTYGKVGVGTTAPAYALDVNGTVAATSAIFVANGHINFGATLGDGGYGFRDNAGTIEYKNDLGVWASFAPGGGDYVSTSGDTISGGLVLDFDPATTTLHVKAGSVGGGSAAYFEHLGVPDSATATVYIKTDNINVGSNALRVENAVGDTIHAETSGNGSVGYFKTLNGANINATVFAQTNGQGQGFYANHSGSGLLYGGNQTGTGDLMELKASNATKFTVDRDGVAYAAATIASGANAPGQYAFHSAGNNVIGFKYENFGLDGQGASFVSSSGGNNFPVVEISNQGSGSSLQVTSIGASVATSAVYISSDNTDIMSNALLAEHSGSGTAIQGYNTGTGIAGHFKIDDNANPSSSILAETIGTAGRAITGTHTGTSGYSAFFNISNVANTGDVVRAETNGMGGLFTGNHTGAAGHLIKLDYAASPMFVVDRSGNVYASGTVRSESASAFAAPVNGYYGFGPVVGPAGYGFRDNAGTLEYKNDLGAWTPFTAGGNYVSKSGDTITGGLDITFNTATDALKITNGDIAGFALNAQGAVKVGDNTGFDGYDVNFYGTVGGFTGSRIYWDASKAAFRTGRDSTGAYWDDANVGNYSFSAGLDSQASGASSAALGQYAVSSGSSAASIGYNTEASGDYSIASGFFTSASGLYSTAMGANTSASGDGSFAAGKWLTAGPNANTIAIGSGVDEPNRMTNNVANSLGIGFNSNIPTLFVGPGSGVGSYGNVGIRTTTPAVSAALEIGGVDGALLLPRLDNIDQGGLTAVNGMMIYNFTDNKFRGYQNGAWINLAGGDFMADGSVPMTGSLTVGSDSGFNGYDINFYGAMGTAGSRMFWDASKSAFRAGYDSMGTNWIDANIGIDSFASGLNSKASGLASTAMGGGTTAGGMYSFAIGDGTTAGGDMSVAMGGYTTASGTSSFAMGDSATAGGVTSVALGRETTASGDYSMALGQWLTAGPAANTITLGKGVGNATRLNNNIAGSMMVGFESDVPTLFVGPASGIGTIGNVGIGTAFPAVMLDVRGAFNVGSDVGADGYDVNMHGDSVGSKLFWDTSKMAIRAGRDAAGTNWNDINVGQYSAAFGYNTMAAGAGSFVTGNLSSASDTYSVAMGDTAQSTGITSVAIGNIASAANDFAVSIGDNTTANGMSSTALGYFTTANGSYSTSMGKWATAQAGSSIAIGAGVNDFNRMSNNVANSLGIGFNSTIPTLFVGPGAGAGTYGNVGIRTTTPEMSAALEIAGTDGALLLPRLTTFEQDALTGVNGMLIYNASTNKFRGYRSGAWADFGGGDFMANGSVPMTGSLTIGDNTGFDGYDVNFYGVYNGFANSRMFWDADKSAFRAGRDSTAANWNDGNVGAYSFAANLDTKASGMYSAAFGNQTAATNLASVASGMFTYAYGSYANATGYNTEASGDYSYTMGNSTTASGAYSLAAGHWVTAGIADNTVAIGKGVDDVNRMTNNTANSFAVGFNSNIPTLFVGPASGIGTYGKVGIGTVTPATMLDLRGEFNVGSDTGADGYDVSFFGTYGGNTGVRMFWDASKGAFRAGRDSDGTFWSDANTGIHSFAAGYNSKAIGDYSIAMGYEATATGARSVALGWQTSAGTYATALGYSTTASNTAATAMGSTNTASGIYSTAMGYGTTSDGNSSTAMGRETVASNSYATSLGYQTTASGTASLAAGQWVTAGPGGNTIAIGKGVDDLNRMIVSAANSFGVGINSTVPTLFVGAASGIGTYGKVGIGTSSPATMLDLRGTFNVGADTGADGYDVNFYGSNGNTGSRMFWDSSKMAFRTGRDDDGAHWNDANVGLYSFASGFNTIASADYSTAMGIGTTASGMYSTALGGNSTASANYSTAMGMNTLASGEASISIGGNTTASGLYSLAAGQWVTAGPNSNTIAIGKGVSDIVRLVNNNVNSLVMGFNSDIPTLSIGPAGGSGKIGQVGVGTTAPGAFLGVDNPDATDPGIVIRGDTEGAGHLLVLQKAGVDKFIVNNNGVVTLKGCPADMKSAGAYCIEIDERAGQPYAAAANACQSAGRMMCRPSQWIAACNNVAGLNTLTDNGEWVDSVFYNNGTAQLQSIFVGNAGCGNIGNDNLVNNRTFRCCL
ncbi:MAG TPA: hypothetical protein PKH33_13970 [bacterium]|nr:hypothetical protein [bacterium]